MIPLRPLTVGEIIGGAFAAVRAHWKLMIGLALAVAVPVNIITVPIRWLLTRDVDESALGDNNASLSDIQNSLGPVAAADGVQWAVQVFAQFAVTGILTVVVSRAVLGRGMRLQEAWTASRPHLWRLLGVTMLTAAIGIALLSVPVLPGLLLHIGGINDAGDTLMAFGLVVGGLGFVHVLISLTLAPPALVLERQPVTKALARSRRLVGGNWWRVFGVLLVVYAVALLVAAFIQLPFTGGSGDLDPGETRPFTQYLVEGVGQVIGFGVTFPFISAAGVLLYIDQRMRREALDLELGRAAGLVSPNGEQPEQ